MVDEGGSRGGPPLSNIYNSQTETSLFQQDPPLTTQTRVFSNANNTQLSHHMLTCGKNEKTLSPKPSNNPTILSPNKTLDPVQQTLLGDNLVSDVSNISSSSCFSRPCKATINFSTCLLSNVNHASSNTEKRKNVVNLQEDLGLSSKSMKYPERRESNGSQHLIKRQWTGEEDRKLKRLVDVYGEKKWTRISERMIGRVGKQCRERWFNHLRPQIKKEKWSEEEERILVEAHKRVDNKWTDIAKEIPGRTECSVKNHWHTTRRRMELATKSSRKWQTLLRNHSTILEDYIKTYYANKTSTSLPSNVTVSTSTKKDDIAPNDHHSLPPLAHDDEGDLLGYMQGFLGNHSLDSSSGIDNVMICDEQRSNIHVDGNGIKDDGALNYIGSTQAGNEGHLCDDVMEGFPELDPLFPESTFLP